MYQRKVRVCKWVRVCVLACSCDRVRALTMRLCAACVRVRRALFVRPSIDGTRTGIVCRYMMHACSCIHAASYTDERIADAGPPHTRAHVLRLCARAFARVRLGATAGGSARRRSNRHQRLTRTSHRGTPRVSPRWTGYAPPFRLRAARHRRRDALGGVVGAARAVVRGGAADARARVCAQPFWARACAGVSGCRYSCA
jgi:hypothetical protein